jgi:hypothetical protein
MDQTTRPFPPMPDSRSDPRFDGARPFPGGPRAGAFRVPPGALDASPEAVLARLDLLSHLLDTAFVIPGTNRRVGLDAAIGLIPVVGDLITTALSSYIIWEARRLGVPKLTLMRMMGNVAIDGAIGMIPLAGDVFDAFYKSNRRNVALLRAHLERKGVARPGVIEGTATRL